MESYRPENSYLRAATACPEVTVADVDANICQITGLYQTAVNQGAALVVFPELSVTGYSLGDLVQQNSLLKQAIEGTIKLAEITKSTESAMVVGLPVQIGNGLYNCAAVLAGGVIKGLVPKQNLPNYGEFYEKRWYQQWDQENTKLFHSQQEIPFGKNLLFSIDDVIVGVEVCEDLWVGNSPSIKMVANGALVIANPSASPELVGKAAYRRLLVGIQAAKLASGYLYAGADWTESTIDVVMSGHQIIAENGRLIAERKPFAVGQRVTIADIDTEHLEHDRRRDTNFANKIGMHLVQTTVGRPEFVPQAAINAYPFLPSAENEAERSERLQSILDIQAHGLAQRVKATNARHIHLGLSGGLDSTLAFLVACQAAQILEKMPEDLLRTYTMPGEASSDRTQNNAMILAELYGIPNEVIPIAELSQNMLQVLEHDGNQQDITYENVQARLRTSILFNKGNQLGGMVLGTGDLSEIALGWCTYNADQTSHYHVNAGVPKTLVQHLVRYVAQTSPRPAIQDTLTDILDTPISPELTMTKAGEISQKTEDLIGPYELHDFFLYHLIRWGDQPAKIAFLANQAFAENYQPDVINKWLSVFLKRFASQQFKRSTMPDGPKVGSVALSPRGDWRMPSDLHNAAVWK